MNLFANIWALIIAFSILMYLVLDGFTLGTGVIMLFLNRSERDVAMSMILPTWDGNQTWLVLAMAAFYGAFPAAFSYVLPKLYFPLFIMATCLVFRGAIFEFRLKAKQEKRLWDRLFAVVSVAVALIQGLIFFSLIQGLPAGGVDWSGRWFLAGLAVLLAYILLGATRLIFKTDKLLQQKMFQLSRKLLLGLIWVLLLLSIQITSSQPHAARLFLMSSTRLWVWVLPSLALSALLVLAWALKKRQELLPYWCMVVVVLSCYVGFGFIIFPYVAPYHLTIQASASPENTLRFIFVGACMMLPVLLAYTGYAYRLFGGKINAIIRY